MSETIHHPINKNDQSERGSVKPNKALKIGIPYLGNIATAKIHSRIAELVLAAGHQVYLYCYDTEDEGEKFYPPELFVKVRLPKMKSRWYEKYIPGNYYKYLYLRSLCRLKKQPNIDLLVTCRDNGVFQFSVVTWARIRKILTVYYQEGSIGNDQLTIRNAFRLVVSHKLNHIIQALFHKLIRLDYVWFHELGMACDYDFVYGKVGYDYFKQFRPEMESRIVGNIMLDDRRAPDCIRENRSNKIIFPMQISSIHNDLNEYADAVIRIVEIATVQLPCRIIVKSRRGLGELDEKLKSAFEAMPSSERIELRSEGDAVDMLDESDLLLISSSTTAYYALVKGIPMVQLKYLDTGTDLDFYQFGASIPVYHSDELRDALHNSLSDPATRELLYTNMKVAIEHHMFRLDGKSGQRFVENLCALAEGHHL